MLNEANDKLDRSIRQAKTHDSSCTCVDCYPPQFVTGVAWTCSTCGGEFDGVTIPLRRNSNGEPECEACASQGVPYQPEGGN